MPKRILNRSIGETTTRLHPTNYIGKTALSKWDFYKLFPLDGGGYFTTVDIVGSTDDETIANATLTGKIFETFHKSNGAIDWERYDTWNTIEKGVWINRWYYLSSTARIYWLTRDDRYARVVVEILRQWFSSVPLPENYAEYHGRFNSGFDSGYRTQNEKAYSIWCDFQLGLRIIAAYWTSCFLEGSSCFDLEFQKLLSEMMLRHAKLLYWGDRKRKFEPGNHQLFRAYALLHAAAMFQDDMNSSKWWECGVHLMDLHAKHDFTPEGIGREGCFSYLLMIMSMYIYANALSKALKKKLPSSWDKLVARMSYFLLATATPANTTPVVNDGYAADLSPFLEVFRDYLPKQVSRRNLMRSKNPDLITFPVSGVATIRPGEDEKNFWLLAEGLEPYGHSGHWHAGKPSVHIWFEDRMILGDCGCPNYDDPLYGKWYRRGPAHFSLTVDGKEDAEFVSDIRWNRPPKIVLSQAKPIQNGYSLLFENSGYLHLKDPVEYKRLIEYSFARRILIHDILRSSSGNFFHNFRLHIPFLVEDVSFSDRKKEVVAMANGKRLHIRWNVSEGNPYVRLLHKEVTVDPWRGIYPYLTIEVRKVVKTEFTTEITYLND